MNVEPILNDVELTSFAKRSFTGRVSFEASGDVSINLQDCSLRIVGASADISVPCESIARSKLSKNSLGTIRLVADNLQILLDIEPTGDKLALFARLTEWKEGFSADAGGHSPPATGQEDK